MARAARKVYVRRDSEQASDRRSSLNDWTLGGIVALTAKESSKDRRDLRGENGDCNDADTAQPNKIDGSSNASLRTKVGEDEHHPPTAT